MAHDLKISIWKVILNQRYHKDKASNSNLFGLFMEKSEKEDPFHAFVEAYIKSFNGKFKTSEKGDRSLGPTDNIIVLSNRSIIHGFLEGGTTGIDQKIKPNSNLHADPRNVGPDETVYLEYYFFIWLPPDTNYAYIMLHSYVDVNTGISVPFFEHLNLLLKDYNYTISAKTSVVPKPIQDAFLKYSIIVGMDIIKNKPNRKERSSFNPLFADSDRVKFRIHVSGLKYELKEFQEGFKMNQNGNPFFIDLSDIGFDNPDDYSITVEYKDTKTKKTTKAVLRDVLNLKPTILLPEDVKIPGTHKPDITKIYDFCIRQLSELQLADGYSTIDEF